MLGDESGNTITDNQRIKLASLEAMWHAEPAAAARGPFALGGVMMAMIGYSLRVEGAADQVGLSNPHLMTMVAAPEAWLSNFSARPWMLAGLLLGFAGPLVALAGMHARGEVLAFGRFSRNIGTAGFGILNRMWRAFHSEVDENALTCLRER